MQSQSFFYRQRIIRINFDFRKIVRKNICDATFKACKVANSVINSATFFIAKNVKIFRSIINFNKSIYFIESYSQRF